MNSLSTQAILGAGVAVALAVAVAAIGSLPFAAGALGSVVAAALAYVAFAAQSQRLRDERHLVYRPVYVRRHDVQRRVSSDD